jgi:cysteinyl-tRNA synthetase
VFEYVRDTNSAMDAGTFLTDNISGARAFIAKFDSIFDVLTPTKRHYHLGAEPGSFTIKGQDALLTVRAAGISDESIETMIAERTSAKKSKNFARSDEIRAHLAAQGIILEDTKEGVRWKRS